MFTVQNLVSITDFRQNLTSWLGKVKDDRYVILLQNSKPKAVLIDPEYLADLEKYANGFYDSGDVAQLHRAKAAKEDSQAIAFDPA